MNPIPRIALQAGTAILAGSLCLSANAATINLGVDTGLVTIENKVAEARYRLNQTNWDQMISNGSDPITASTIITANLGTASSLNAQSWDFSLSYESGDDGVQGLTFTLDDGNGTISSLVYDVNNPIAGLTPTGFFDGIKLEARAGVLRSPGTAQMDVTNLSFSTSPPSTLNGTAGRHQRVHSADYRRVFRNLDYLGH